MLRPVAAALLLALGLGGVQADTPLWIQRPQAAPWLPSLQVAADRTGLPVALLAELVGQESGFNPAAKNPHSTARGCAQQIAGNDVARRYHLDRMRCDQSILAGAIELREKLDHTGSLELALLAYGTTSGFTPSQRRRIEARMIAAARYEPPSAMPATITAIDSHAPATLAQSTSLTAGARTGRSSAAPAARPRAPARSPA